MTALRLWYRCLCALGLHLGTIEHDKLGPYYKCKRCDYEIR